MFLLLFLCHATTHTMLQAIGDLPEVLKKAKIFSHPTAVGDLEKELPGYLLQARGCLRLPHGEKSEIQARNTGMQKGMSFCF